MRHHLFEGKWLAALHRTEMAGELATLRGGGVFCHGVGAWALTQQHLLHGGCVQAGCQVLQAGGVALVASTTYHEDLPPAPWATTRWGPIGRSSRQGHQIA
jgi:hypothetical protein